ncbi:hypothetical protein Q5530_18090 [Saccharothrix sp. BKS2]|uniref:hypothetical protein n=1 Tax=Saccharothrix sp. BKS2 TaxID=3064400 RepID=UPI0039E820F7
MNTTDRRHTREAAAGALAAEFESWTTARDADADPFVVEVALEWQVSRGGDPARWAAEDIQELLVEWFPRKVTMNRPEWPGVLSTLHRWVDFLSVAPVDRPGDPAALHAVIDQVAPVFFERMADERHCGPAKFWATRMIEHGVDPQDGEGVRRFVAAVQAGEVDYDQDVLAEIMRRGAFDAGIDLVDPGVDEGAGRHLPPVVLPSDQDLAAMARDSALVTRLRVLVTWVGAGRALTATKRLRVADARELAGLLNVDEPYLERARSSGDLPQVSLMVEWAKAVRVLRVVKGRLVPVKSAVGLLDRPLDLWRRAYAAFPGLGPVLCAPTSYYEAPSPLGEALPEVAPGLLLGLYTAGGTPLPVELLVQDVRNLLSELFDLDFGVGGLLVDFRELMWRRDLDNVLSALETLGAAEETAAAEPWELDEIAELSGEENPDPRLVRLTPLGLWGVRETLSAEGFDAPTTEELAERPLDQVCEALRHAAPELAESVMANWVGVREAAQAAAELAECCAAGPSPSARLLAWSGLSRTGEPGVEQARRLRATGGVPGAVATEWLVRHGELAPSAARRHEMILALAENLAARHEHDLLIDELTRHPLDDQIGFAQALADTDHPDRYDMLATISEHHPDRGAAAAARAVLADRSGGAAGAHPR